MFVQTHTSAAYNTATAQIQAIKSLSGKAVSKTTILNVGAACPSGCVTFFVSADVAVSLHVKGRVDVDSEISKATKKLQRIINNIDSQNKILSAPGYVENARMEALEADKRKLTDLEAERDSLQDTIEQFERLKLE